MAENELKNKKNQGSSANGPANKSVSGASIPAPSLGASIFGALKDGYGDLTNSRPNEAQLDKEEDAAALTEEKTTFTGQNYGPITYSRSSNPGSGFEASYFPSSKQLYAEVRGKVRFADGVVNNGGTVSSPNIFMNRGQIITLLNAYPTLAAQILPFYQWGSDEKQIHLQRFQDNISATTGLWENTGMSFQINKPGWEDIAATPNINIKVSEGTASTQMENYGPMGILTRVNEGASDHLQIEIVKQLSGGDATAVNNLITTFLATTFPSNDIVSNAMRNALQPAAGDARGVRSYLGNDKGGARGKSEGHNNFMSLESDRSDNPKAKVHKHSVFFENDKGVISDDQETSLDAFLADPSVLLQNPNGTVTVKLHGYASAGGTTDYNSKLTQKRLDKVSDKINTAASSKSVNIQQNITVANQTNNSDRLAEADLSSDPMAHEEDRWRQVYIIISHSGRGGQNVVAHEFGHVFGLDDEYVEVANGYNRPATATTPTSLAGHDQLAKNAGVATGAPVADDSRILSTGNNVQAEHYSTFADVLRILTGKPWKINTPGP